jgi:hypothetical protein
MELTSPFAKAHKRMNDQTIKFILNIINGQKHWQNLFHGIKIEKSTAAK